MNFAYRQPFPQRRVVAIVILGMWLFQLCPSLTVFAPETAHASSSWNPTLLVNTEAFQVIDDANSSSNLSIKFGSTVNKSLIYDRTNSRFTFDAPLYVQGALKVTGTMSGDALYVARAFSGAGLTSCSNGTTSKLLWDSATQSFSCGTDQGGGGGGLTQAQIDGLFVNQSGDTMTGGLLIQSGNPAGTIDAGLLLEVKGTASGDVVHAQSQLQASGSLVVAGTANFQGALTFGDALGDAITVNAGAWTFANDTNFALSGGVNGLSFDTSTLSIDATNHRVGIGTTTPKALLDVKGTASGDILHAEQRLTSSGSLKVVGDVQIDGTTFYANTTLNRVGVGTLSPDTTLEVSGTASGASVLAMDTLASSGSLVVAGTTRYRPSATQSITAVSNTILANATMIVLDPNADYTMTSTPTIADGTVGQILLVAAGSAEANKVILQDQDTLGSSNLQLGTTAREITADKLLELRFDGAEWVETGYTTQSVDIRTYTSGANTWTKPTGAKAVYVECVGAGGGGGGGTGGAAATARIGGGGGGGGAKAFKWLLPGDLGATETATAGTSGTAGNGGSSGAGTAGGAGGSSTFGSYLTCYGGGGGKGGVAAAVSGGGSGGGTAGVGVVGTTATNIGGSPGVTAGANGISGQGGGGNIAATNGNAEYGGGGGNGSSATPGASGAGGSSLYGAAGGGGGGGITTGNAAQTPGAGGKVGAYTAGGGGAAGTGGASCTVGTAGTTGNSTKNGQGGGGGGANTAGTGCAGGAGGGYGGGGGGGGAGKTAGGAGGLGGAGTVKVYTFF